MPPRLAILFPPLLLVFLAGCAKKDEHAPCWTSPVPVLFYQAWPPWLDTDSVHEVGWTIPIAATAYADHENKEPDVTVELVAVTIRADANDSLLYAEVFHPGTHTADIYTQVVLDSTLVDLPATLRVVATNSCGASAEQQRALLIAPQ